MSRATYSWCMRIPDEPFRVTELRELGITRAELRSAVAAGRIRRLLQGVYVDAAVEETLALRARAIALVLPRDAVVSDRCAAWLHGVDAFGPAELEAPLRLEVASVGSAPIRREGVQGARRALSPQDVMHLHGVPVTTPLRTACDLGRLRGRSGAFAAMCMLARRHGLHSEQFLEAADRLRGQRGVVQLRSLAARVTDGCESEGEAWTLLAMLDDGLPAPVLQHEVMLPGWGLARIDLAYPWARVAVEYFGEEHHSREVDVRRDLARIAALEAAGWTVIVVRKDDFTGSVLLDWLSDVRQGLDEVSRRKRRYARSTMAERGFAR